MKIKNINVHFTEAEIDKKIRELGARISEDYAGESVCLICILKGASFFTCELAKRITVPVEVEFMSVSSYGSGTESSGIVKIVQDLSTSIEGKNVIVVEDIIDTGRTLSYLLENLKTRSPKASFPRMSAFRPSSKPSRKRIFRSWQNPLMQMHAHPATRRMQASKI